MRRRYDMRKSDNYLYTGRVSYICSGTGEITVVVGFPVMRSTVAFATIPWPDIDRGWSSSSSSSSSTSSGFSESSESAGNYSSSSSSSTDQPEPIATLPRIYVASYTSTGFIVAYEGIPEDIGYIEFNYACE